MKIVQTGTWDELEKEIYGGKYGLVITCETEDELKKLCTPEVKKALFIENDLEIKIKKNFYENTAEEAMLEALNMTNNKLEKERK